MRKTALFVTMAVSLCVAAEARAADDPAPAHRFALTIFLGAEGQSSYADTVVLFSNGEREYLRLTPNTGLLVGLEPSFHFTDRLSGYLGLAFAPSDADYIKGNNFVGQVDFDTTFVDLGVRYDLISTGTLTLGLGGGLSYISQDIDGMVWENRLIGPTTSALGIHGSAALDIGLTPRLSLRLMLKLGVAVLSRGDLERELAFAQGEFAADTGGETQTMAAFALGLTIGF